MTQSSSSPIYSQIAFDIALRVARAELKENTKIYGRSVMSSEYGVSPETIRRSLKLLSDMGIVEVRHNSGAIILSREKAKQYILRFNEHKDVRMLQKQLKELILQQEKKNKEILNVTETLINTNEKFSKHNPFQIYEADVPSNSPLLGRSLTDLKFWQETGATIIAIRRDDKIILSPGPYAVLQELDILIFVGDISTVDSVKDFING